MSTSRLFTALSLSYCTLSYCVYFNKNYSKNVCHCATFSTCFVNKQFEKNDGNLTWEI